MNYNRLCSCGKLVLKGETCPCKKVKTVKPNQGWHPSTTRRFQKLRKEIIQRDEAHCQRCRIKFGLMNFDSLQAHHIKSWRDYPDLAYDENNLITVCKRCNLDLGNKNKLDFSWEIPEKFEFFL